MDGAGGFVEAAVAAPTQSGAPPPAGGMSTTVPPTTNFNAFNAFNPPPGAHNPEQLDGVGGGGGPTFSLRTKGGMGNKGMGNKDRGGKGGDQRGPRPRRDRDRSNWTAADQVADMFGSRIESSICPFFSKIGACRHGTTCSRTHIKPEKSRTLLLAHVFADTEQTLAVSADPEEGAADPTDEVYCIAVNQMEEFWEETFFHMAKFGEIEDLITVDNISEHMSGNAYVKYYREEDAIKAFEAVNGKYYCGRFIKAEFSPCTEFREARCRAFTEGRCPRGQNCNFLHIRHIPTAVKRQSVLQMYADHPEYMEQGRQAGRPLKYKYVDKVDWETDNDARDEFVARWWAGYTARRQEEEAWKQQNAPPAPAPPVGSVVVHHPLPPGAGPPPLQSVGALPPQAGKGVVPQLVVPPTNTLGPIGAGVGVGGTRVIITPGGTQLVQQMQPDGTFPPMPPGAFAPAMAMQLHPGGEHTPVGTNSQVAGAYGEPMTRRAGEGAGENAAFFPGATESQHKHPSEAKTGGGDDNDIKKKKKKKRRHDSDDENQENPTPKKLHLGSEELDPATVKLYGHPSHQQSEHHDQHSFYNFPPSVQFVSPTGGPQQTAAPLNTPLSPVAAGTTPRAGPGSVIGTPPQRAVQFQGQQGQPQQQGFFKGAAPPGGMQLGGMGMPPPNIMKGGGMYQGPPGTVPGPGGKGLVPGPPPPHMQLVPGPPPPGLMMKGAGGPGGIMPPGVLMKGPPGGGMGMPPGMLVKGPPPPGMLMQGGKAGPPPQMFG